VALNRVGYMNAQIMSDNDAGAGRWSRRIVTTPSCKARNAGFSETTMRSMNPPSNDSGRLKKSLLAGLIGLAACSFAHASDRFNVFFIGHSLMSEIPGMTKSLVEKAPLQRLSLRHQDIPGASLRRQWNQKDSLDTGEPTYGGRYHVHLKSGEFDTLVLTDSVPRGGRELEAETVEYLGRFAEFAREHRPDIRIFYYETWHHLTSGTVSNSAYDALHPNRHLKWRERIDADAVMWGRIVRTVNEARPGRPAIRIIPGGSILAAISDAIDARQITEWKSIADLFSGDIHLNRYGQYVMTLAFYSAITGKSAVDASSEVRNLWGAPIWNHRETDGSFYPPMRTETVRTVQEIVDRVLATSYR
jgi:hypothetical protein